MHVFEPTNADARAFFEARVSTTYEARASTTYRVAREVKKVQTARQLQRSLGVRTVVAHSKSTLSAMRGRRKPAIRVGMGNLVAAEPGVSNRLAFHCARCKHNVVYSVDDGSRS